MRSLAWPFLLLALPLAADEVTLKNGDRLTGTVVDLAGGKLQIKTEHAGTVKVAWDQVVTLRTEKAVRVKLKDGTERAGTITREEGGPMRIQEEHVPDPFEVMPGDVTHFNEPPVQWHGNLSLAGKQTDGNTHTGAAIATGELTRKGKSADFLLKGDYQYSEQSGTVTARSFYGQGKVDYRLVDEFYVYVSEEILSDRFKNLTVRTISSIGVGYNFLTEDWIKFSGELGLAYIHNNFRDEIEEDDDGYLGGRASARLELKLPLGFELKDTFTYYPNFEETADWQIRNEVSVQRGMGPFLGGNWTLTGGVITEIDNEPPAGNEEHDNIYHIGLGYKF